MTTYTGKIGKHSVHAAIQIYDKNIYGVYYYDNQLVTTELAGHFLNDGRIVLNNITSEKSRDYSLLQKLGGKTLTLNLSVGGAVGTLTDIHSVLPVSLVKTGYLDDTDKTFKADDIEIPMVTSSKKHFFLAEYQYYERNGSQRSWINELRIFDRHSHKKIQTIKFYHKPDEWAREGNVMTVIFQNIELDKNTMFLNIDNGRMGEYRRFKFNFKKQKYIESSE